MNPPAPIVLLGGLGAVGLLVRAGAGAGSPARSAQRVGGLVQGRLGRFFTWAEFTASSTARKLGLDNTPTLEAQQALQVLTAYVLDPLRGVLGSRLRVTSGYRSPAVNEAVDGSASSQHMRGEAVDLLAEGLTARELAGVIVRAGLPFDQVI